MNNEKHWLCWSPLQNALHIESQADGLRINLEAFTENRRLDYIPIGVFETEDEACAQADRLQKIMEQRDAQRSLQPHPLSQSCQP